MTGGDGSAEAEGPTLVRGPFSHRIRKYQAARKFSDADLYRGGGASHHKNLGDYLQGRRLPSANCLRPLLDSFLKAGKGLTVEEIEEAFRLWWLEVPAWDRHRDGQTEVVSQTRVVVKEPTSRAKRAPKGGGGKNVRKSRGPRPHHLEPAGERGFEPLIA